MIYFVADNRMFALPGNGKRVVEIPSDVLRVYRDHLRQNAERTDWKTSGSGAEFMRGGHGGVMGGPDVQKRADDVTAQIFSVLYDGERLLYSLCIDATGGVYVKEKGVPGDGILLSDNAGGFREFAYKNGRLALSCVRAGEAHLGIWEQNGESVRVLTEGSTRESDPSWSAAEEDVIFYAGCGLAKIEPAAMSRSQAMQIMMMNAMGQLGAEDLWKQYAEGPWSIFRFDCRAYELKEVLADKKTNFRQPMESENGDLYYIAYPYREPYVKKGLFGKKVPVGDVPRVHGIPEDDVPVLCCRSKDGKVREIRKGVFAYTVTGKGVYFADKQGIALLMADGSEQRLTDMPRVSYISVVEE